MTTTTIRLTDELKERIGDIAERSGKTTHGLILEAIAEKVEHEERREAFDVLAEERYEDMLASGRSVSWERMRAYLDERLAGRPAPRPRAKKMAD
jgi:predicted transcriptional regulator